MSASNFRFLKRWELSALLALCICLCVCTWAQGRQRSISEALIRLHVIAVSDDEQEQELKLRVRDAVLGYISPALEGAEDAGEAREIISGDLEGIEQAALSAAEGRSVTVTLSREKYPTRQYEGFTLPAGKYESLRIILGSGQGKNWWCIVFPPVCLSAVQGDEVAQVMSDDDYSLITDEDGYELRFRAVELWGELVDKLSK